MAFFSDKKLRRIRITIDDSAIKSDSPEIQNRLDRIAENYGKLDEVLSGLEDRFENDEAFLSLFPEVADGEEPVFDLPKKKKRKWRPRKPR
ncbi:hypothetical protein [Mariniblastus fucicola]|uniref:Uncharacterized protein n=1 Tax=Mariniblastus fucicola TaxID=980251 RepID=A0A5B9PAQ5_9BACT|nr:hypothetical protein [Mariniblastus fucicola]QEG23847.1 hypothetical protein MFFC18_37510 [Mariniblastus fucicola]